MANKVTKIDNFQAIRAIVADSDRADLVEFIDHEIGLLRGKAERRANTLTPAQKAGLEFKAEILHTLRENGEGMRIADIRATHEEWAGYNPQKFTPHLQSLMGEHLIEKYTDKRANYYKAV